MPNQTFTTLFASSLALVLVAPVLPAVAASNPVQKGEMAGYLLVPNEKVPETYNAGFSMYVAAWPLLDQYPGQRFQTGLFGTWMFARKDPPPPIKLYSDIEGGLGWWRDTEYATETPKFIMDGVAPDYDPAQGYELAGFVWFQGWNDMVDSGTYPNRDKPARKADLQARSPRLEEIRGWWREAAQAEGADIVDLANTLAPATELVANSN